VFGGKNATRLLVENQGKVREGGGKTVGLRLRVVSSEERSKRKIKEVSPLQRDQFALKGYRYCKGSLPKESGSQNSIWGWGGGRNRRIL